MSQSERQRIHLIHRNFPGQFHRISHTWAQQPGWEVIRLG